MIFLLYQPVEPLLSHCNPVAGWNLFYMSLLRAGSLRLGIRYASGISENIPRGLLYPSRGSFVQSNDEPALSTQRPIPLNVMLTRYAPHKHPLKYGDLVGEIRLASFTTKDLEFFSDFILRAAFYLGIPTKGPTPLPRKVKRWTVIRSPFVMAKTKQNFERITYRRQIKLYDANPETIQILLSVASKHAIAGVGTKATLYTHEDLEMIENMDVPRRNEHENPLAVNKVDIEAVGSGEVAQAVMELLKDPRFAGSDSHIEKHGDTSSVKTDSASNDSSGDKN